MFDRAQVLARTAAVRVPNLSSLAVPESQAEGSDDEEGAGTADTKAEEGQDGAASSPVVEDGDGAAGDAGGEDGAGTADGGAAATDAEFGVLQFVPVTEFKLVALKRGTPPDFRQQDINFWRPMPPKDVAVFGDVITRKGQRPTEVYGVSLKTPGVEHIVVKPVRVVPADQGVPGVVPPLSIMEPPDGTRARCGTEHPAVLTRRGGCLVGQASRRWAC